MIKYWCTYWLSLFLGLAFGQVQDSTVVSTTSPTRLDSIYYQSDSLGQQLVLDSLQAIIPRDTLYNLYQKYLSSLSLETSKEEEPLEPVITWDTLNLDYGQISLDTTVSRIFRFRNIGTAPLLITTVKTSCGCTATNYPKNAILPEKTAELEVSFESKNRLGVFEQAIIVYDNTKSRRTILRINVEVIAH